MPNDSDTSLLNRLIRFAAIGLGAVPFAFALIRAYRQGNDFRYLWLAIATFLGATIVMRFGQALRRQPGGIVALAGVDLVAALIFGVLAVRVLMSGVPAGALMVAFFFSFCFAMSYALAALDTRPPASSPNEHA
jgi:hypothetical protein